MASAGVDYLNYQPENASLGDFIDDIDSNSIDGSDVGTLVEEEEALVGRLAAASLGTRGNEECSSVVVGTSHPAICTVCNARPAYSKGQIKFPTCGLTCARKLESAGRCAVCGVRPRFSDGSKRSKTCIFCDANLKFNAPSRNTSIGTTSKQLICVICKVHPSDSGGLKQFTTCGTTCAIKLITDGAPPMMCDYCHRKPQHKDYPQCGASCKKMAQMSCLMCRSQPKLGKYHFCGRFCRNMASRSAPFILEIKRGHTTFTMVEAKFKSAWKVSSSPCPQIKRVYKIVESVKCLAPYDAYRRKHGSECFRYHGTKRQCRVGEEGQNKLCQSSTCAVCSIIRTSFKVSLASRGGAFGKGIYTSSATNKAAAYAPDGMMILAKAVLGKPFNVQSFAQVTSCPLRHNSVVYDRNNGHLNETVLYRNDAIRPVFLIVFCK